VRTGKPWTIVPKVPFKEMYVEPHPYLPYVYKKNFLTQKETPAIYPLNGDKGYMFRQEKTNSLRYLNGTDGSREILIPKPENLIRINCLGASTTGNNLQYQGIDYSYPLELEKILHKQFPSLEIEVNNCGIGGRTTAEILIDFVLTNIDTKPDVVIIYHGYNDLIPSLTPDFQSDYSHARRNLGESYHLYRLSSILPYLPFKSYNFCLTSLLLGSNVRFTLLDSISRGKIDINSDFQGMHIYRRNLEHIINLCKANDIHIVLSTYCHFLYTDIQNSPLHTKLRKGVIEENVIMKSLAEKHKIPLIDNFSLIPPDEKYFVDSIHFSHEGMNMLATNISIPVIEYIEKNLLCSPSKNK
jgi:lysophospholipase L1-like esterase